MTFLDRLGLAITAPRGALALAGKRAAAGRAGSDLLAAIAILLVATELRWLVQAIWLGAAVDAGLGLRAIVQVLTGTLSIDLGFLVVAALVIAIGGRLSRELGRAFDLACVAVLPLVYVDLAAGVVSSALAWSPPDAVRWIVLGASFAWTALLVILAIKVARGGEVPPAARSHARWLVVALAAIGVVIQLAWLRSNLDEVRPLETGQLAPEIALHRIGPGGALGERVSIRRGRITVLDFWATWCGPCLRSLPALDEFARTHPDVDVLAIDLDDAQEARAMFDRAHYGLNLLADDGEASKRYNVLAIPHRVLIDREGHLVSDHVVDLDAQVERLRQ